jgi:tRNA G18 (ribose-2'-O)-methylase SpoU
MKSNVNISMIARSASCMGADTLIITGQNRITKHISRDCNIPIKHHNSLMPVIRKYKENGYKIIGLEQATNSSNMHQYKFADVPTFLVVGNECKGLDQEVLDSLDEVIEIPLFGKPHSLNVAVATSICLFEYAKQRK